MTQDKETLKRLYKKLKMTEKRLHEAEQAARSPIAVIGMGCRFPGGADTPDKFQVLLANGVDAVCEVPPDRWEAARYYDPDPDAPGKVTTNQAGFLQAPIDGFDCPFFRLSPKEVERMDPQQRMLLEVCWETFEHAGIDITSLKASKTGVFCGIANSDYAMAHLRSGDVQKIDAFSVTGTALSAAVGRISYLFGFEGPNLAVDTACSSSLVSVHLACRSIENGESELALAAGINLILSPEGHIGFSKIKAISADGRCKSFDDAADGYGRGEGCGMVLLKRLSEAEKDGDTILAVIRATGVNQDGTTNGFTAPSSRSQQKLLRNTLQAAGLRPEDIGYIEAHGTGTPLGDPIEMDAIDKIYSPGRPGGPDTHAPLFVGSVKANIGHLEAAAGIAAFIKTVLTVHSGTLFGQIHFKQPNRHIPWQQLPVRIPPTTMPWPDNSAPRTAAVSSFGFSGTNAHAIVQQWCPPDASKTAVSVDRSQHILPLSAIDGDALQALVARYDPFLRDTHAPVDAICHTAATGRAHFPHRVAVVGATTAALRQALQARALDCAPEASRDSATTSTQDRRTVFLFTGQGSQYHKMGWDLFNSHPGYRAQMERCDALLQPHMERSLIDLLYARDTTSLHDTRFTQPVIFSVAYALTRLLAEWGIQPALVIGHSIGEYVAAVTAGIFTLEEALELVSARSRLIQSLPDNGSMAVIAADEQRVREILAEFEDKRLSIAAVNSPKNTVISGNKEAVGKLCARLRKIRVAYHPLNVPHAFHSYLLDPVVAPFRNVAERISYTAPQLPILNNLTGRMDGARMATADYWTRQLREPVRFYDSMRTVAREGYRLFVEVGGTSTLTSLARQCLPGYQGRWLTTLAGRDASANLKPGRKPDHNDWEPMLHCLAELYMAGCDIDWKAFDAPHARRRVALPNYPFQRKRYWMDLPHHAPSQPQTPAHIETDAPAPPQDTPGRETPNTPAAGSIASPDRRERIAVEVKQLIYQCSEIEITPADGDTNLFELGFASLMIARFKDLLQRTYGLDIQMSAFYDLMDTFNKTVEFIDRTATGQTVPAGCVSIGATAPLQPAEGRAWPTGPMSEDARGLINQQMALMERQLAVMSEQLELMGNPAPEAREMVQRRQAALTRAMPLEGTGTPILPEALPAVPDTADKGSLCGGGEGRFANRPYTYSALAAAPNGSGPASAAPPPQDYVAYRGVTHRDKLALNKIQKNHLRHLIDRYTKHTAGSKALTDKYRSVFANTRNISGFRPEWKEMIYQIVVDRAQGAHFTDIDGRDYLDISMGFGVYLLGHNPSFVQTALQRELDRGTPIGPMSAQAGQVATLIHELTGVQRVAFFNTGTEAVMAAVRIARTVTGRKKIALFSGSYHGHFDGVMAIKAFNAPTGQADPMSPGTPPRMVDDVYVLDYDTEAALQFIEARGHELAAVLVEPVQSRRPEVQPKAFLQQLRQITAAAGTALIFDEMIVGFRTHPGGAQAWFDVQADIVTYGKVVGGGVPIGVVAGRAHFLDAVDGGMWRYGDSSFPEQENTFIAGTFNHHPLAMAGAHAMLSHLAQAGPALQERLNQRTTDLAQRLNSYFESEGLPMRTTHFGSLFRIPVKGDQELLYYHLLCRGIYIWEGRNCFLSTAHTDTDIDDLVSSVQESIEQMRAGGLFGDPPAHQIPTQIPTQIPIKIPAAPAAELPLSAAQNRMYVLSQTGGEKAYHIPVALLIDGPVDSTRVETIFQELIEAHEILRTGFEMAGDTVVQKIHPQVRFAVENRQITQDTVDAAIREYIQPFDLAQPPLLRVCLARVNDTRHLLILDAHHIVFDGISANLLFGEFIRRYGNQPASAPATQYRDYVAAEHAYLDSSAYERDQAFWLEKFATSVPLLNLPADVRRPPVKSFRGDRCFRHLDADVVKTLRQFARSAGTSLHMTLLAAYFIFLHKLSGNTDVVVGATYDGRDGQRFADCLGMFVHTLPVRCELAPEQDFRAFLDAVKKAVLEAHDRQRYPFEHLVEKLAMVREPGRNPLFDTMFVYETQAADTIASGGVTFTEWLCRPGTAICDLVLDIADTGRELKMSLEYSTDLFRPDTAARFLDYFACLVEQIPAQPSAAITDIDMIPADEKRRLLEIFNDTAADYPREKTLVALFETQAAQCPQATAIIDTEHPLTYDALNRQANRLAHYLRNQHGVGPDDRVALLLDRGQEMVIGMLGILKAGGAYVPIDPSYPRERIHFMLRDSGCKAVLTQQSHRATIEDAAAAVDIMAVCRDPAQNDDPPERINRPQDLAYVIYTSGSTGKPKGVLIEHRNVVRLMTNARFPFDFTADDVWTLFHSCCFDFSVWEIYGALLYGGRLVIVPETVARDTERFLALLKTQRVTVLNQTPQAFYNLAALETRVATQAASARNPDRDPDQDLALRYVIFGGEALKPAMLAAFHQKYPRVRLVNMYGITETTVHVTCKEITADQIEADQCNIGGPIPTLSAYIVDRDMRLLPLGVPGELVVGGEGVARGYLNRDELTRAKFVPNPFKTGQRLYRSGDLARWLPNGDIEYLGRMDTQVKIRGYRIERGEIESALVRHPDIHQAAVLDREDAAGNRFLCAYLVSGDPMPVETLRRHLGATLPDYMIPAQFIRIETMPLTANGKIDTKALQSTAGTALTADTAYAAPDTPHERLLVDIWQQILGREKVGVMDNYFALGGDSIKAIQILSRLRQQGLQLEIRHIFETPFIRALAQKIERQDRLPVQEPVTGQAPLTAIQTWFFNTHDEKTRDHYTQAILLRSAEPVHESAIETALQHLQAHHDHLRTTFVHQDGTMIQHTAGLDHPFSLTIVDLRQRADAGRQRAEICAETPASLRIATGPLMKTVLFKEDDADRLLIVIHHLVVDGVSWRILLEDLNTAYRQARSGEPLCLPAKSDAFGVWAKKIADYATGRSLLSERPFWHELTPMDALEIPMDEGCAVDRYKDGDTDRYEHTDTVRVTLDRRQTEALLTDVHTAYRTEINDLLLTALGRCLRQCYGTGKGFIEVEGHGRQDLFQGVDVSRTVGWFTSIHPAPIDLPDSDEPGLQIKQVKEGLRRVPRKGIGYGILHYLCPEDRQRPIPTYHGRILFNYLGRFDADSQALFDFDPENAALAHTVSGTCPRESEIVIQAAVIDEHLQLNLEYSNRRHTRQTVERFAQVFQEEITLLIEHCLGRQETELTPHDLTYKTLTLPEMDTVIAGCGLARENLKDIYPLSPLQEGMLFHAMLQSESDAYFMQISFRIKGELDPACFEKCWNLLVMRHDILRTVFVHKGLERPLQVVARRAHIDFTFEDISDLSDARQSERLAAFRSQDREKGVTPLTRMPMRVSVFKKHARSFEVVWSYHHLLIDGWCAGILMSEFFEAYGALRQDTAPAERQAVPYGAYIRWIEQLDRPATIAYWRNYLEGYDSPAVLPKTANGKQTGGFHLQTLVLEFEAQPLAALKQFAAGHQVTLNTVIQTVWGLVLARFSGADDVVFGTTVSGRPSQVAGIESMVGLFINTVPVRLRIDARDTPARLVRQVQADALQGETHHYGSLADIQALTSVKQDLLDHVLVFENYPLADALIGLEQRYPVNFSIDNIKIFEQTHYDLSIVVEPGDQTLRVVFQYNGTVLDEQFMTRIKTAFGTLLQQLPDAADKPLGELRESMLSPDEKKERDAFIRSVQQISEDF